MDITDLVGIAVGQIGLSLNDFLLLTEPEFEAIYKNWKNKFKQQEHEAWEIARWQAFRIACPPKPSPTGKISLYDFIKFPWEEEPKKEAPASTQERFRALTQKWQ